MGFIRYNFVGGKVKMKQSYRRMILPREESYEKKIKEVTERAKCMHGVMFLKIFHGNQNGSATTDLFCSPWTCI